METPASRRQIWALTAGLLLLSLSITASPASAVRWQPLGPDADGTVLSLAFAPSRPSVVYAGTRGGGVSRSVDGGQTWTAANVGLTNPVVLALAVSAQDHRRVWAATEEGLYLSTNAGHSWDRVFTEEVGAVALDPDRPSVVYIGTRDRMFRSGNNGATWLPMGETLVPFETRFWVPALVVAPSRPQTLYAAYQGARSGIFRSDNGGIAWSRIHRGAFSHLAVDPRDPRTLWAVDIRGVLLTTDAGATWTRVLERADVSAIALSPSGERVYVAETGRILLSRDHGTHWRRIGTQLPSRIIHGLAVDSAHPDRLLAGPEMRGVFGFDPDTGVWQRISDGLVGFSTPAVGLTSDGAVWTASFLGLYQTNDNGASWRRLLPWTALRTVAVAPADAGNTVYAGGQLKGGTHLPALYRTEDGSGSWTLATNGLPEGPITSLTVDPVNRLTVYASTMSGVYRTADGGETWASLPLTAGEARVAIDPEDPDRVYITQKRHLYVSRDGGATWHLLLFGATPGLETRALYDVAVAPSDSRSLVVIDGRWVFVSRDSGSTWQRLPGPPLVSDLQTAIFAPGNEQVLLVGGRGGVAFSTDGGGFWQMLGTGISGLSVHQLRYDPTNPHRLYAATSAAGVMVLDPAP